MLRRVFVALGIIAATVVAAGPAAYACGGLIAPNGAVRLVRTTTFVAWEDGVEHYITNFEFDSVEESFGSIVPLPGEPTSVDKAGDWTLQRLEIEAGLLPPQSARLDVFAGEATAASDVEVVLETRVDTLDITVVKGGGNEVAEWAGENGFELSPDTPGMLERYAERSPYFMATRFDAEAAAAEGFSGGDGIPIHVTIPVEAPWVPLQILGLGKPWYEVVEADVFLLTPEEPTMFVPEGVTLVTSEVATDLLLDDLRSDERMEWVPEAAWFTHLEVESEAQHLDTDLAIDGTGAGQPSLEAAGVTADALAITGTTIGPGVTAQAGTDDAVWMVTAFALALAVACAAVAGWTLNQRRLETRTATIRADAEDWSRRELEFLGSEPVSVGDDPRRRPPPRVTAL